MGGINQIGKEAVILLKMGLSRDIKRLLTLTWKSESLVNKIFKSSVDTI